LNRGTQNKSYQDIQDLQDQLKAHMSIGGGVDGLTLHIDTLRDKLPGTLELAIELLTKSSFPEKQLEIVRQEQLAQLEQELKDPQTVAFTTLQQLMTKWPKSDPRYAASIAEQIDDVKKVKLADIKQFYADFIGAGHGELAIVGDFDPAVIAAQVEKGLAGWQSKKPYKRLEQKAFGVDGTTKSIDIKDKEQTTLVLGMDAVMKDSDVDYPGWVMMSQVLGGDLGSRAWMRLREHEGLSYGVATWAYADAFDGAGGFGGFAIVAPQNLSKAKASLLDEIGKISSGKISAAELQHAKDTWLKEQDTSLSNDGYVTRMLGESLYRGRTAEFAKQLRAKIAALTTGEVERVAQKRLEPKRLVVVDAGDASKAK
jgi:zinc protease